MKKKGTIILLIVAVLAVAAAIAFDISNDKKSSPQYPVIKFDSDTIDLFVDATEADLLDGVTATDPEDGDITKSIVIEGISGITDGTSVKVTYAAVDSQNHVTKAERTVNYIDYTRPRFSMSRPLIFGNAKEINFMPYITATDVFEGDISGRIKYSLVNSATIEDEAGEYEIKISVTNKLGDTVSIPLTVGISDEYANWDKITLSDYLVYAERGTPFDPKAYVVSYTDGKREIESARGLSIINNVNTDEPGVYIVEYSASRGASKTRLVVVVE
mgnify:CR=1 FL=1